MKKDVLMSIKKEYVNLIIEGVKKYEFRKYEFKNVNNIYIYCPAPVKKIVGYLIIEDILYDKLDIIWEICQFEGGVSKKSYYDYYKNREYATAIKIEKVIQFQNPINPYELNGFKPPQSYYWINEQLKEYINQQLQEDNIFLENSYQSKLF